jgi:hypothetical protein
MVDEAGTIVIVDSLAHAHGRLMAEHARAGDFSLPIRWLTPTINLAEDLRSLTGVAAVAIPLGVRGATPADRFTQQVAESIAYLRGRGIPVFVAAGSGRANLIASTGIAVSSEDIPGSGNSSKACVRAAIQAAIRSRRHGECDS